MRIVRMTLATTEMAAMIGFYNQVFGADLKPIDGAPGFHRGSLAGVPLVLCPNEVAGVVAEQNRQQFTIEVDDLDRAVRAALASGGQPIGDAPTPDATSAAVRDPDGNSIELVQA